MVVRVATLRVALGPVAWVGAGKAVATAKGLGVRLRVVSRSPSWNGKPLYTFVQDARSGRVTGNGATDSFGGMSFTWHAAIVGKTAAPSKTTTTNGGCDY